MLIGRERATSPAFATRYNDLIAKQIAGYRDRFTAFAHLPMTAPAAAADELERVVNGYGFRGAEVLESLACYGWGWRRLSR